MIDSWYRLANLPSLFSPISSIFSMMDKVLLILFILVNQAVGRLNVKEEATQYGNVVTILSIDGGGIRGIIPSVILQHLEAALQEKDEKARIADYFDVIAGSSTGGIIATMLTAPHPHHEDRPALNAKEILQFYKDFGPRVFNQTRPWSMLFTRGPKYDGKELRHIVRSKLNQTRLKQTLTNVVIPAYDLKLSHPIIFSSFQEKYSDVLLSDICIGTSASPTYFPAYHFKNKDHEFNLIDGVFTANHPALIAVSEVIHAQKKKKRSDTKFLVISLGTGNSDSSNKYDSETTDNWTGIGWLRPLMKITIFDSPVEMTDYYIATAFQTILDQDMYLRVQEYELDEWMTSVDNSTRENLDNLEMAGKKLLEKPVLRVDEETFVPEETGQGTNAEALKRLAEILYEERQQRLTKKSQKMIERATF